MKKTLIALGAVALVIGSVWAGEHVVVEANVDVANNHAFGALGSARASNDSVADIGCDIDTTNAGTSIFCGSIDATNNQTMFCTSSGADYIRAAAAINGDSYINFVPDPNTGDCTELDVSNWAGYAPKQ